MSTPTPRDIAHIFEQLRKGLVPERGIEAFAVGIDAQWGEIGRQLDLAENGPRTNREAEVTKKTSKRSGRAKASKEKVSPAVRDATAGEGELVSALLDRIAGILEEARSHAVRAVNSQIVLAYWHIGREIVEHQQGGARRAAYGDQLGPRGDDSSRGS